MKSTFSLKNEDLMYFLLNKLIAIEVALQKKQLHNQILIRKLTKQTGEGLDSPLFLEIEKVIDAQSEILFEEKKREYSDELLEMDPSLSEYLKGLID